MSEHRATKRVAILGGGMAGLTTAWELSAPERRDEIESITVYQRGWRLGGKGASSRGPHSRIEEHGLHVLLGYYHATFAMMQKCYDELDRPRTNPTAPLRTWTDAVKPSGDISLAEQTKDGWEPWSMHFSTDDAMPGARGDTPLMDDRSLRRLGIAEIIRRSFQLLVDFHQSNASSAKEDWGETGGVIVSATADRPQTAPKDTAALGLRAVGLTALAGACEMLDQLGDAAGSIEARNSLTATIQQALSRAQDVLAASFDDDADFGRMRTLVDLVFTNVRGMLADGLLTSDAGFAVIDHLDYRDWLRSHGAASSTLDSGLLRGMYDLVFAYQHGDGSQPAFAAGLGLDLASRMLLDYQGAIFWKMQAGMGEVIFAPLYEVLRQRGVEFRFFHNLEAVGLGDDGSHVDSIQLRRQAGDRALTYEPLIDAGGLPAWPNRPDYDQLDAEFADRLDRSESNAHVPADDDPAGGDPADDDLVCLRAGEDFDVAVLAVSLGIIPTVCPEIVENNQRWKLMVDNIGTVATQALQLWLTSSEQELGWQGPDGTTLSGFRQPFDTWASMGHLIDREDWPVDHQPATIAYFCSALDEGTATSESADDLVRQSAVDFMNSDLGHLWPAAVDDEGFTWSRLTPPTDTIDGQYWRANTDPSDRYVQSLPGTDRYRLRPDESGYANLVLAGDWTNCGLNAGCIEAATRSGILAATAVQQRRP